MNSETTTGTSWGRLAIILGLTLTMNTIITVLVYQFHEREVLRSDLEFENEKTKLAERFSILQEEVRVLEAVSTWEETRFFSARYK